MGSTHSTCATSTTSATAPSTAPSSMTRCGICISSRGSCRSNGDPGVAHPRYANPSQGKPGRDEHELVRDAAGELAHRASYAVRTRGGCSYKDYDTRERRA